MFTGKILPTMAPHGLAFGEHCGKFLIRQIFRKFMIIRMFYKFNPMFMKNAG